MTLNNEHKNMNYLQVDIELLKRNDTRGLYSKTGKFPYLKCK